MDQAGKALSGWTSRRGNEIPPVLTSIQTSPDLTIDFVLALFSEDIKEQWRTALKATGLLICL